MTKSKRKNYYFDFFSKPIFAGETKVFPLFLRNRQSDQAENFLQILKTIWGVAFFFLQDLVCSKSGNRSKFCSIVKNRLFESVFSILLFLTPI